MFTGIIYKITGSCGKLYIGSTVNFAFRKYKHNNCSLNNSTSKLLQQPLTFEIIRTDQYNTVRILRLVEQFYLDIYDCVNKNRAFPNKNLLSNSAKISKQNYYQKNKKEIVIYSKIYRETNKETIKKYRKNKVTCECGCVVSMNNLTRHKKTKKHLSNLVE